MIQSCFLPDLGFMQQILNGVLEVTFSACLELILTRLLCATRLGTCDLVLLQSFDTFRAMPLPYLGLTIGSMGLYKLHCVFEFKLLTVSSGE